MPVWYVVKNVGVENDDREAKRGMVGRLLQNHHSDYRLITLSRCESVNPRDLISLDSYVGPFVKVVQNIKAILRMVEKFAVSDPPRLHSIGCRSQIEDAIKQLGNTYPKVTENLKMALENLEYFFIDRIDYFKQGEDAIKCLGLAFLILYESR